MSETFHIDEDLFDTLKARAEADGQSLTLALNAALRRGLSLSSDARADRPFEQRVVALGNTTADIRKALSVSASLEDEAILDTLPPSGGGSSSSAS